MKISLISTGRDGAVHISMRKAEWVLERMKKDAQSGAVGRFRDAVRRGYELDMCVAKERIGRIAPAVEIGRADNGAMEMRHFNGLVVLEVKAVLTPSELEDLKRRAMDLPSTWASFIGASGRTVKVLVSVCRPDGTIPQVEDDVVNFYRQAYQRLLPVYDAALGRRVTRLDLQPNHAMLMPLDPSPLVNPNPAPFRITDGVKSPETDAEDEHLLAQPEKPRNQLDVDIEAYEVWENAYRQVAEEAWSQVTASKESAVAPMREDIQYSVAYLSALALQLQRRQFPQEEAVCHIWNHWRFKDGTGVTESLVRSIVDATYAEEVPTRARLPRPGSYSHLMREVSRRLQTCYVFRHNTVMGYTEYRPNHTWLVPWKPVTDKVVNTMTADLQMTDVPAWEKDVRRYIFSTHVSDYNPVEEYLFSLHDKWDGRDHIGMLARTVPTDNPEQWNDWFHTWLLGMVAQWQGRNERFGNSIVPLLISRQGNHKSTFCRQLLPPELRSWGYTDNLSLSDERAVHLAMAQMLLINLDEFNSISVRIQEGFLKNIVQLPSVKVKRPYARHVEEAPRLASFIATTNMTDVLTDPSGSRRFIGIPVTGLIDVSHAPNYTQLYAQAQAELRQGRRYWFDEEQTHAIIQHNQLFRQRSNGEDFFYEYFEPTKEGDSEAQWMTTVSIIQYIKSHARSSFQVPAANRFGRMLTAIPGMVHKTTNRGEVYLLKIVKV